MSSPPPRNPYTVSHSDMDDIDDLGPSDSSATSEDDWLYAIYLRSEQKPMGVICHLYYRMHVYWQHRFGNLSDQEEHACRTWRGGQNARVPDASDTSHMDGQTDPPLTLAHVLTVLEYLFEEQVPEGHYAHSEPLEPRVAYLPRLYAVNAQAVRAFRTHLQRRERRESSWLYRILHFFFPPRQSLAHFKQTQYPTRHRPYDMLAAIFMCASTMPATKQQEKQLCAFRDKFAHMYLNASQNFDYQDKDVYTHQR